MNPLSSHRIGRRTVLAVLFVWLFAMGSSWAHACLVQEHGAGVMHGVAEALCDEVRDDGTQAAVRLPSASDLAHAAAAPAAPPAWIAHANPRAPGVRVPDGLPPRPGVPARTLYARLAL